MSNATHTSPDIEHDNQALHGRHMVVIFDNDFTPLELVIIVLMAATGCEREEAQIEAWEAMHYGKAPVHFDSQAVCEEVAVVIRDIGVKTEVLPEWRAE